MSTASDVANTERWLADARAALAGGLKRVERLKEHVAAAEAAIPELEAAVAACQAAHEEAAQSLAVTAAHAGVADAEGSAD